MEVPDSSCSKNGTEFINKVYSRVYIGIPKYKSVYRRSMLQHRTFSKSRVAHDTSSVSTFNIDLLSLCVDIHPNPGPDSTSRSTDALKRSESSFVVRKVIPFSDCIKIERITFYALDFRYNKIEFTTTSEVTIVSRITWDSIYDDKSVNKTWEKFQSLFMDCINAAIPNRRQKKKTKPWISPDIKRLVTLKRRLFKRAKSSGTVEHWNSYKKIRNKVKYDIGRCKSQYLNDLMSKPDNTKQFWSKRQSDQCSIFEVNGIACSDPIIIADSFNSLFSSYFTEPSSDENYTISSPNLDIPTLENIYIHPVTVYKKLKNLKNGKAPGPDSVTSSMLKLCAASLSPLLTDIYNYNLSSGEVPSAWKDANIAPIHKKSKKGELKNYRPVALTSLFCIGEHSC
ncbi:uncharacterized protein [Antedon mediterranea]|uniref:uncharacterized protein n=1 Tax=Antedon mediterranea TaxID=105859 RepID=UPI003AF6E4C1